VDVTKPLDGVSNVVRWRSQLGSGFGPLALLAVLAPGCHLGCQTLAHKAAQNQPLGCPDALMHQAVHGVEDRAAKGGRNQRPEEVSTRIGESCKDTSDTQSAEDELVRWQSGQAACATASSTKFTGEGDKDDPAMAGGTEDTEGTFTPFDP
jgi:hypothetical protein